MLHFAAAREHGRNALYQLLIETDTNIGYRDELYRTARDISIQANITDNTMEIDRYVMQIATKGKSLKRDSFSNFEIEVLYLEFVKNTLKHIILKKHIVHTVLHLQVIPIN